MNTMMLALLHGRLRDAASRLRERRRAAQADAGDATADELGEVFRALDALYTGRYGLCSDCGCALDPDELLRKPQRLVCAACEAIGAGDFSALIAARPRPARAGASQPYA